MVDKDLLHHLATAVHSSSAGVVYSPSEVVAYFPCEAVDLPSFEVVDPSLEELDHNWQMMKILSRVWMEVDLHLGSTVYQNPGMQEAQNKESLDGSHRRGMVDGEITLVVHHQSPVDIQ